MYKKLFLFANYRRTTRRLLTERENDKLRRFGVSSNLRYCTTTQNPIAGSTMTVMMSIIKRPLFIYGQLRDLCQVTRIVQMLHKHNRECSDYETGL